MLLDPLSCHSDCENKASLGDDWPNRDRGHLSNDCDMGNLFHPPKCSPCHCLHSFCCGIQLYIHPEVHPTIPPSPTDSNHEYICFWNLQKLWENSFFFTADLGQCAFNTSTMPRGCLALASIPTLRPSDWTPPCCLQCPCSPPSPCLPCLP